MPEKKSGHREKKLWIGGALGRKGRAAAAAAGGIRILKGKSGTHHIGCIINRDAIEVLSRKHINKKLDAEFVQDKITLPRFFLDIQAVLETRTSAGNYPYAEAGRFREVIFARKELLDFDRRVFCNVQFDIWCCNCCHKEFFISQAKMRILTESLLLSKYYPALDKITSSGFIASIETCRATSSATWRNAAA